MKGFLFRIVFILFFVSSLAKAQNTPSHDFLLSVQGHAGYIISHRSNMAHLIKGHIFGAEINYVFRTDGSKPWQQIHKYPEIGMCYLHLDLANPEQLGTLEAIYPYTNIRLNKLRKKMSFNLRLGGGLAWLTKSFDRITNHKNNVIGSPLNGFVNLRLNTTFMVAKSLRLNAGVGLTHASNGAMSTPNLGLNMATVNVGLDYVFGNKTIALKKDSIPRLKREWQPSIIAVVGVKELMPPDGKKFFVYGLQANLYRTLNYKNKIGGGIEIQYNTATEKVWANEDTITTAKVTDILQAGAKVSYAFVLHRLSLPIDFGMYFFKKQPFNGVFFHRIGLRYMINKHLIANVTLLTHFAKADYFEWGIGYQF